MWIIPLAVEGPANKYGEQLGKKRILSPVSPVLTVSTRLLMNMRTLFPYPAGCGNSDETTRLAARMQQRQ